MVITFGSSLPCGGEDGQVVCSGWGEVGQAVCWDGRDQKQGEGVRIAGVSNTNTACLAQDFVSQATQRN